MFIYMCLDNVTSCLWSIPSWDRRPSAYPSPSGPRYWPCSQAELVMFWRNLRGNPREWTRAPLVGFSHMGPVEVTSFHHERCPVKVMTVSWRCPKDGRLPALQIFGKALLCRKNHVLFVCVCVLFLGTFWTKNPKFSPKQVLVFSFLHIFWRKGFLHVFPTKFRFFIDPRGLQPVGAGRGQGHVEGRRGEVYLRRSKSRWENPWENHERTMERHISWNFPYVFSICIYNTWHIQHIYIYIWVFGNTTKQFNWFIMIFLIGMAILRTVQWGGQPIYSHLWVHKDSQNSTLRGKGKKKDPRWTKGRKGHAFVDNRVTCWYKKDKTVCEPH